jgi:hypothetical protein
MNSAEFIFSHIHKNKGDDSIPDERCIAAIRLLQETVATHWSEHDKEKVIRMRERENEVPI